MAKYIPLFILLISLFGCAKKTNEESSSFINLSQDSLQQISNQWKEDSLGCARQRDPKKIRQLIRQLDLIGKDSVAVMQYLGPPDGINLLNDSTVVFYYHMACGVKQRSSYNFYCNLEHGKLASTQTAILN